MTAEDTLEIPVLFCSQTGNASDAAESLSKTLPVRLSTSTTKITSYTMTLDDFLEIELQNPSPSTGSTTHGLMPTIFCVVCSSYGSGHAPLGGYKFRELCDHILSSEDTDNDSTSASASTSTSTSTSVSSLWKGCRYAILGLGDSKYVTYFCNPTILDEGLTKAGALRVGQIGKADVSGKIDSQSNVIQRWSEDIISDLALVLKEREAIKNTEGEGYGARVRTSQERMAARTIDICRSTCHDWDEGQQMPQKETEGLATRILVAVVTKIGPFGLVFVFSQLIFLVVLYFTQANGNDDDNDGNTETPDL